MDLIRQAWKQKTTFLNTIENKKTVLLGHCNLWHVNPAALQIPMHPRFITIDDELLRAQKLPLKAHGSVVHAAYNYATHTTTHTPWSLNPCNWAKSVTLPRQNQTEWRHDDKPPLLRDTRVLCYINRYDQNICVNTAQPTRSSGCKHITSWPMVPSNACGLRDYGILAHYHSHRQAQMAYNENILT